MSPTRKLQLDIWKRLHAIHKELDEVGNVATEMCKLTEGLDIVVIPPKWIPHCHDGDTINGCAGEMHYDMRVTPVKIEMFVRCINCPFRKKGENDESITKD